MAAKIRSDIKIGNLEKKLGLAKGAIRNPDGTDARSDKRLGTLQKEYERMYAGPPVRTSASMKAAADALKQAAAAKKAKASAAVAKSKKTATKAPATKKAATSTPRKK
jgi:hypothetical protein